MSANTPETPGECCSWSPRGKHWVCYLRQQTRETGQGNCGHNSPMSADIETVRTRKLWLRCSAYLQRESSRTTTLFPHLGGCVRGSTICGNEFTRARWDGKATFGEASLIGIAAMEMRLQFWLWHQHQHILHYTTISKWATYKNHPLHLSSRRPHHNSEVSPIATLLWTPIHTPLLEHQPLYNSSYALASKHKMMINTSTSFFERKLTSPGGSVSNFDAPRATGYANFNANSTTHNWDGKGADENEWCSSWLEQYLRNISSMWYQQWQQSSRYNRTVCHLWRSSPLEVKTVEVDSTIDYWA